MTSDVRLCKCFYFTNNKCHISTKYADNIVSHQCKTLGNGCLIHFLDL